MTQEEFNEMFLVAMNTYGAAEENEIEVPTVDAADVAGDDADYYSLPMVKNQSGVTSYAKVPIPNMMSEIANQVETTGMMQSVTQAQFDAIFYPNGRGGDSSSSSSD